MTGLQRIGPAGCPGITRSVLALTAALAIGAAVGSVATRAIVDPTTEVPAEGVVPWDQQKLDAMEGRQAAERVRTSAIGFAPLGRAEARGDGGSAGGRRPVSPGLGAPRGAPVHDLRTGRTTRVIRGWYPMWIDDGSLLVQRNPAS